MCSLLKFLEELDAAAMALLIFFTKPAVVDWFKDICTYLLLEIIAELFVL